ncbi:MAG: hypothetical protein NVS3B10_25430 [Polyangiales bacterium]
MQFYFHTVAAVAGVCPATVAVLSPLLAPAQSTPTDTQVCDLTAAPTSFCPVNLTTGLGGAPNDHATCLEMDVVGTPTPSGPPGTVFAPVLNSWETRYDCLPNE